VGLVSLGNAWALDHVELWIVDDPIGAPIAAVVSIDHIVEERSDFFTPISIGHRRRDVVIASQFLDTRFGEVVNQPIWREGHAQRPPASASNLRAQEIPAIAIGADSEVGVGNEFAVLLSRSSQDE